MSLRAFLSACPAAGQGSNPLKTKKIASKNQEDCFGKKRLAMTAILALNEYIKPDLRVETSGKTRRPSCTGPTLFHPIMQNSNWKVKPQNKYRQKNGRQNDFKIM
jgi:hypothetical protein